MKQYAGKWVEVGYYYHSNDNVKQLYDGESFSISDTLRQQRGWFCKVQRKAR